MKLTEMFTQIETLYRVQKGSRLREGVAALQDSSQRRRFECWCCGGPVTIERGRSVCSKRCSGIAVPPCSVCKGVRHLTQYHDAVRRARARRGQRSGRPYSNRGVAHTQGGVAAAGNDEKGAKGGNRLGDYNQSSLMGKKGLDDMSGQGACLISTKDRGQGQAAEIQVEGTRTWALIGIGAVFCAVSGSF